MKSSTKIVVIVAMSHNRVIGKDGELPWHFSKDMERFQQLTAGNPLVLGRKTHENIVAANGSTLPDRKHIVVTSTPNADFSDGVITAGSVEEAIEAGETICRSTRQGSAIYIAGGESIYEQTIDVADQIEMTQIHSEFDGDAYFPELHESWTEEYRESHDELDFVKLVNQDDQGEYEPSPLRV